jgi:hypothetical protein
VKRREARTLGGFLDEFIEKHKVGVGDRVQLITTDKECVDLGRFCLRGMLGWIFSEELCDRIQITTTDREYRDLGSFFIRAMVGWVLGHDQTRLQPSWRSSSPLVGIEVEEIIKDDNEIDEEDESSPVIIH